MRIYKYQIEEELRNLKKIDTHLFDNYIDRITSNDNRIVRVIDDNVYSYYCTHCNEWHTDKKINVKAIKKCPHCGRKYMVVTKRNVIKTIRDYITYIELNDRKELIIRCFYFEKAYDKNNMKFNISYIEVERINYDRNIWMKLNTHANMGYITHYDYGYNNIKRDKNGYYGRKIGEYFFYGFVVSKGIRKIIEKTKYKYSCLDVIARKHIDIVDYLKLYDQFSDIELLVKNGNYKLIDDMIKQHVPQEIRDRRNRKYLKHDLNIKEFQTSVCFDLNNYKDIKNYTKVNAKDQIRFISKNSININKTVEYLIKQKKTFDYYKDYYNFCKDLGIDLKKRENLYPSSLSKAHDEMYIQYQSLLNKVNSKLIDDYANEMLEKYRFIEKGLIIYPSHSQEELIEESLKLDHCVQSYAEKVANRKTAIFFIRNKKKVNDPYVTLELKSNKVIQCRGYKNNVTNPLEDRVKKFVNNWCRKFGLISCFD